MSEITSQIADAHKNTSEAKARLDRIDAVIREDNFDPNAAVADSLNNPIITHLRTRYLEFVNREANYSRKYGANHLAVVNLRNQIRDLRKSILEELKRIRQSYLSDHEIAKQKEEGLEKRLAEVVSQSQTINQAQVPLRDLESSAKTSRTIYDNFLQRYAESLQQQAFPISDARILSSASPPTSKSSPKTALILLLAAAGGVVFGVAVGTLRELMSGSLWTKEQVENALQTACISVVPLVKGSKQPTPGNPRREMLLSDQRPAEDSSRIVPRDQEVIWTVLNSPFSRFAEAIRSIKLAVDLNSDARGCGSVIGFTSSLPQEGKSTIAASLALLIAQSGARVILVDCDLRNPSLSRKLAPKVEHGVLDVVVGNVCLDDAIWRESSTNLMFLPASTTTRNANSSEILAAAATKKLFEALQSMYDYVIVDLAPLMPIVDTRATTRFVDSYVFVIEWGCTGSDAIKHAFKGARNVYENLLGVVLTKVDIDRLSTYDPVGGNYYKNEYYAQYGMTD
jgi:succinoglycan biosynthesis transport protein ExoP